MMRWWRKLPILPLGMVILGMAIGLLNLPAPVQAASPKQVGENAAAQIASDAGNYCIGCHSSDDPVLQEAVSWRGGVEMQAANPCLAVTRIEEELFYTGRLMQAVRILRSQLPDNARTLALDERFAAAEQSHLRLLDTPVSSLDAFISEAQMQRYQMGKIYTGLNVVQDSVLVQRILIWGGLVSVVILGSLVWGYWNTRRLASGSGTAGRSRLVSLVQPGLVALLVFLLFALPIFRDFPAPLEVASAEEQEKQTTLDESSRAASAAERASGRSWMMGRIGAAWAASDPATAEEILLSALEASAEAQMDTAALWGDIQVAQEAAAGSPVDQENAALIAASLQAAQSRAWNLRVMAEDWLPVDQQRALELLEQAINTAEKGSGIYRDLDLRAIAVTLTMVDPEGSLQVMNRVEDPFVRAWGFREIAVKTGSQALFNDALASAEEVDTPVLRAYALTKIAQAASYENIFDLAYRSLNEVSGAGLAYSLARLSMEAGNSDWAAEIDPAYPAAVALAQYLIGDYPAAWEAAAQISDPLERAIAQAAISGRWGRADKAREIIIPLYRDRALHNVIQMTGDVTLAEEIQNSYDRAVVLIAAGKYDEALQLEGLQEAYPLVAAGTASAHQNPDLALKVLERLQRESDKSIVLNALVSAGREEMLFQQALEYALAARQRGDALAPVMASLELAAAVRDPALKTQALQQARQAAERISIK